MIRSTTISLAVISGLFPVHAHGEGAEPAVAPNIIYILADDMGLGDVRAYNKDGRIPTPNIDRLAEEGMKFTDAHSNSSVCTPTRYGILTGRYAWRTVLKKGVTGGHSQHLINPKRETVASLLKQKGYRTACIGKWHLGMDWSSSRPSKAGKLTRHNPKHVDCSKPIDNGPLDLGFDYFFGISASLNMSPHAYIEDRQVLGTLELLEDLDAVEARGFTQPSQPGWAAREYVQQEVLATLAAKACDWIRKPSEQPFFVYFPLPSPHSPIVPSDRFEGRSGLNEHGDFCMETDWVVGELLKTLDEGGLAENTIVIFTADNGTSPKAKLKEMQAQGHFSSLIYRGLKGTTWEGGHRVPFLVRWPEEVEPGGESGETICTTDLIATCAALSGERLADDVGEDSVSFLPALKGGSIPEGKGRMIVHHSDGGVFAMRRGKWKLMLDNRGGSSRKNPKDKAVINKAELLLFDLEGDPVASTNLSKENPEVVESMKRDFAALVSAGRSTAGAPQPTDLIEAGDGWKQLDPVREYLKSN